MNKRSRTAKRWVASVLVIAAAAGLYALIPRERLLLREATRITSLDAPLDSTSIWRSDHEAILMRRRGSGVQFEAVQLDTKTGIETPLGPLNRSHASDLTGVKLLSFTAAGWSGPYWVASPPYSVSRDGRLIAIDAIGGGGEMSAPSRSFVYSFADARDVERRAEGAWSEYWLPDSHSRVVLLEGRNRFGNEPGPYIRTLGRQQESKPIDPGDAVYGRAPVGVAARNHFLAIDERHELTSSSIVLVNTDALATQPVSRAYSIKLPTAVSRIEGAMSTHGDRIAWTVLYDSTTPAARWLQAHVPALHIRSQDAIAIWTSRLDGSEMRVVGTVPLTKSKGKPQHVEAPQWLPGDRKLSFTYRNSLYTVPVPQQ